MKKLLFFVKPKDGSKYLQLWKNCYNRYVPHLTLNYLHLYSKLSQNKPGPNTCGAYEHFIAVPMAESEVSHEEEVTQRQHNHEYRKR